MFEYSGATNTSLTNQTIWDRNPLSALGPDLLTNFSYSLVAEILRRGWFDYYMRVGIEPQPAARLVRQYQGRAYLNLSLSAKLEADNGIEPLAFLMDGTLQSLAEVKSGFLAGFIGNAKEKKVWSVIAELEGEAQTIRNKAREWHQNVQGLKWSQAEILQVMEQIERVGSNSMTLFFAARHNLELGLNQILWALQGSVPFPQSLAYASALFDGLGNARLSNLIESDISGVINDLAQYARNEEIAHSGNWANWSETLPHGKFKSAVTEFLEDYGHRAAFESELRYPRWHEDPTQVFDTVLALSNRSAGTSQTGASAKHKDDLLGAIDGKQRKSVQQWLERIPTLLRLQSQALDAFAYILSGSRRWIKAAAVEAMSDGRLAGEDDAFFFALEELKEMMTGERNVSDIEGIQAQIAERKAEFAQWQQVTPAPLLVGAQEVASTRSGLPTAADLGIELGDTTPVPTDLTNLHQTLLTAHGTLSLPQLDAGLSALLPQANGAVVQSGHLLDPAIAAAWASQRVVVGGSSN